MSRSSIFLPAALLLAMISGFQSVGSHAEVVKPQAPPRHPDWLHAQDIETLLSGNTVTARNEGGSYRWWKHYLKDGALSWASDHGKRAFGLWYIARDQLCEVWLSGEKRCSNIRFAGKVVRFDDPLTGQPYAAAVLRPGDDSNLRAKVTPRVHARLRALGAPDSAVTESDAGGIGGPGTGRSEKAAVEAGPKPLKIRIIHPNPDAPGSLIAALSGVQVAAANERADLVWDVVKGEVAKGQEIIAYPRTREPGEIQLVIDALHLMEHTEDLGVRKSGGLSLRMMPRQNTYRAGESIGLTLDGQRFSHGLLFNIGPYGEIDIIYPVETDYAGDGSVWPRLAPTKPLTVSAVAGPPFGANMAVGVVSSYEPRVLLKTLKSGGGPAGMGAFLKALRETEGQVAVSSFHIRRR